MSNAWINARAADIRDVVNEPAWQALRAGLVGRWTFHPAENVAFLRSYLAARVGTPEEPLATRRVLNYLTGSGFRLRVISHRDIDVFLAEVRARWTKETV